MRPLYSASLEKVGSVATHACLEITVYLALASVRAFALFLYIPYLKGAE